MLLLQLVITLAVHGGIGSQYRGMDTDTSDGMVGGGYKQAAKMHDKVQKRPMLWEMGREGGVHAEGWGALRRPERERGEDY